MMFTAIVDYTPISPPSFTKTLTLGCPGRRELQRLSLTKVRNKDEPKTNWCVVFPGKGSHIKRDDPVNMLQHEMRVTSVALYASLSVRSPTNEGEESERLVIELLILFTLNRGM